MKKYIIFVAMFSLGLVFVLNCQERPVEQSSPINMYVADFQPTLSYSLSGSTGVSTNANIFVLAPSELPYIEAGVNITTIILQAYNHDNGTAFEIPVFEYHVSAFIPINDNDDSTEIDGIPLIYTELVDYLGDNSDIDIYDLHITFKGVDSKGHSVRCTGVVTVFL